MGQNERFFAFLSSSIGKMEATVVPRGEVKNRVIFRVFVDIFLLVCCEVTIFLLTQRSRLGGPFIYFEHASEVHKKVFLVANPILSFIFSNLNFFHFS